MGQRQLMDSGVESVAQQPADGLTLVQDAYGRGDWNVLKVQNKSDGPQTGEHLPKIGVPQESEKGDAGSKEGQTGKGDAGAKDGQTDAQPDGTRTERTADALKAIENPSPAIKKFTETLDKFDKAPDKAKAMGELGPQFEESIKTADLAFGAAMKDVMTNGKELGQKMVEAEEELGLHLENAGVEMEKLPNEADQKKVKEVMAQLLREEDPAKEQELIKQLEPFDRVHAAVKAFNESLNKHEPTFKKMEEMANNMQGSLTETAALRLAYSDVLTESGDTEKAAQVQEQARFILQMMSGGGQEEQDPDNDGVPRFRTLPWTVPQDNDIEIRKA